MDEETPGRSEAVVPESGADEGDVEAADGSGPERLAPIRSRLFAAVALGLMALLLLCAILALVAWNRAPAGSGVPALALLIDGP